MLTDGGRLQLLQRHAFNLFPDTLKEFGLSNIGAIEHRDALFKHLRSTYWHSAKSVSSY
jgi:hypothetical protein